MPTFDECKDGYNQLWQSAEVVSNHIDDVDEIADRIVLAPTAWAQYIMVQKATGVPAYVVGIIHQREASGNFNCHLHNGDPLSARTTHVPAGRPEPPSHPPFTWTESAIDALTMPGQTFNFWKDWSAAGIAFVLERYNGFGYRSHGVNSPYLWGFTTAYSRGLFVADGRWDANAINGNPGGMAILRRMVDRRLIDLAGPSPLAPVAQPQQSPAVNSNDPIAAVLLAALQTANSDKVEALQAALGVRVDDDPGPLTMAAIAAHFKAI